jgi:hypothetical protein
LIDLSGRSTIYHASLSEPPANIGGPFALPEHWQVLEAAGVCLGTVTQISRRNRVDHTLREIERNWNEILKDNLPLNTEELDALATATQLIGLYDEYYNGPLRECFWSSKTEMALLIRVLSQWLYEQRDKGKALSHKYLLSLLCGRTGSKSRCNTDNVERLMSRACERDETGRAALETLCKALEEGMQHRRLFILDDYHIWGTAPNNTLTGDRIFVLIGCSVPVVLHKLSNFDEYRLVGECYCHGFMDGEALGLRDEGLLNVREIMLR